MPNNNGDFGGDPTAVTADQPAPDPAIATTEGAAPGTGEAPPQAMATPEGGPPTTSEGLNQPSARNFMELPSWLGGPQGTLGRVMGGMAGYPGNQVPVGARVSQRHGGFLTGLAGVLLEGLAGAMAPSAEMAYKVPLMMEQQRQQRQQTQLQSIKLQEELAEAPARMQYMVAQARIDQFKAAEMSRDLNFKIKSGMNDVKIKAIEAAMERGDATPIGTAPTQEDAQHKVEEEQRMNKNPARQIDYYAGHLNPDGSPKDYTVYEWYPANTLREDQPFDLPAIPGMPASGNQPEIAGVPAFHKVYRPGQNLAQMNSEMSRLSAEHTAQARAIESQIQERRETRAASTEMRKLTTPVIAIMKNGERRIMEEGEAIEGKQDGKVSFHIPTDPKKLESAHIEMNGVQAAMNQLSEVNFANVQPGLAAALIAQDDGIEASAKAGMLGIKLPTERYMANLRVQNTRDANQDTRNFVTSLALGYEAITHLPRLQSFAQVNRMSEQQMNAARGTLPVAGDDDAMARQKLTQVQRTLIDPVRKAFPHGQGYELDKAWNEQGYQPQGFAALPRPGAKLPPARGAQGMTPQQLQDKGYVWKQGDRGIGWYKPVTQ